MMIEKWKNVSVQRKIKTYHRRRDIRPDLTNHEEIGTRWGWKRTLTAIRDGAESDIRFCEEDQGWGIISVAIACGHSQKGYHTQSIQS